MFLTDPRWVKFIVLALASYFILYLIILSASKHYAIVEMVGISSLREDKYPSGSAQPLESGIDDALRTNSSLEFENVLDSRLSEDLGLRNGKMNHGETMEEGEQKMGEVGKETAQLKTGPVEAEDVGPKYTVETSPWLIYPHNMTRHRQTTVLTSNKTYYVAVYETPKSLKNSFVGDKLFSKCQYSKCMFIDDYSQADVIWFIGRAIMHTPIHKMWHRPAYQRWVWKTVDPYSHDYGLDNDTVRSQFNWIASFKLDSDILNIMGMLQLKDQPIPPRDYTQIFRQKTKVAAWFVSHCDTWSLREKYVERMAKVAPVDIYGECGPLKCGSNHDRMKYDLPECFPLLTNNYKFYIAFENALCIDYVSEKFFKLFVDVQVIPVVRGAVDYKNAFPRNTYIDANDFNSPEDLMQHLVNLGNDEQAYVEMLREKDKWKLADDPEFKTMCRLCKKLHTNTTISFYDDINKTLNANPNECWAPKDLGPEYDGVDIWEIIANCSRPR